VTLCSNAVRCVNLLLNDMLRQYVSKSVRADRSRLRESRQKQAADAAEH